MNISMIIYYAYVLACVELTGWMVRLMKGDGMTEKGGSSPEKGNNPVETCLFWRKEL